MATLTSSTALDCSIDELWQAVRSPAVFAHVTGSFMKMVPVDPATFPERWAPGEYVVQLRILGVIPVFRQVIGISFPETTPPERQMRDNGRSRFISRWDHRITLRPYEGGTLWTDCVEIEAGILTRPVWLSVRGFFAYRTRRLRRYVENVMKPTSGTEK